MFSFLEIVLFLLLVSFAWSGLSIAPFLPTSKKDLQRIHHLSGLKAGQKFLEIGFGDARVCRYIAKHNPEIQVCGVENSPFLYTIGIIKGLISPLPNLTLKFKNGFKENIEKYDVIYIFGMANTLKNALKQKFENELAFHAKVISYTFLIEGWSGKTTQNKPSSENLSLYIIQKS